MKAMTYVLENPRHRRHHRRHHARRNPEGLVGESMDYAKQALVISAGVGGGSWLSRFFPRMIKSNKALDAIATGFTAVLPLSLKRQMPGGSKIAEDLAVGMAAAGVLKGVQAFFPPAAGFLPRLPANAGGGGSLPLRRGLPLPMPAPSPMLGPRIVVR